MSLLRSAPLWLCLVLVTGIQIVQDTSWEGQSQSLVQEMESLRLEVETLREKVRQLESEKQGQREEPKEEASTTDASAVDQASEVADEASQKNKLTTKEEEEMHKELSSEKQAKALNETETDIWGIAGPEGGSDKHTKWRKKKGGGLEAWLCAAFFVMVFASAPLIPHVGSGARPVTRFHVIESACLYIWLIAGLYTFTQRIIFQSVHFEEPRTLSLEEAVYLMAQIVTTVGYGDITPRYPGGQVFVGIFVFTAIMLAGQMISELTQSFEKKMELLLTQAGKTASDNLLSLHLLQLSANQQVNEKTLEQRAEEIREERRRRRVRAAVAPMLANALFFLFFAGVGVAFFVLYPGENKTVLQGVYMSLITLSTVGFGAFTPVTHGGMVFGAFWMLFGVASLASLVSARAAFALALRKLVDRDESNEADYFTSDDESARGSREQTRNIAGGMACVAHNAGLAEAKRKKKEAQKKNKRDGDETQDKAEQKAEDAISST